MQDSKNNQSPIQLDFIPETFRPSMNKENNVQNKSEPIQLDFIPETFQPLSKSEPNQSQGNEENNLIQKFTGMSPEQQKNIVTDIINLAVKAPGAAMGSIIDIFSTPVVNAGISAYNAVAPEEYEAPYAQSASKTMEQGVEYLENKGGLDEKRKTPGYEGAKLAYEVGIPGGLSTKLEKLIKTVGTKDIGALAGKLEKFITDLTKTIGSTKPQVLAGAVGAGEAANYAKEEGAGVTGQLGSGVGGAILAESLANPKKALQGIGKAGTKIAANVLGLGRNNLKTEAIDAAQRLGLEGLPSAAVSDSTITGYANQLISKIPFFGDKIKKDVKKTSDEFQKAWEQMLDSIGPSVNEASKNEIKLIYKKANNLMGKEDVIDPNLILSKIKEIREQFKSYLSSDATKKLEGYLDKLENALTPEKADIASLKGFDEKTLAALPEGVRKQILEKVNEIGSQKGIYVKDLLRTKVELNKIMRDKNIFDRTDTDTLGFLRDLQQSVQETLTEYGKTNPKWYKAFKEADEKFSKLSKRENLENALGGKIEDFVTNEVAYVPLVKVLENPKQQKFLKNNLGETNYKKLEDFVEVAKAMSSINRNVLNPSGSAMVAIVATTLAGLVTKPLTTVAAIGGTAGITKLLTDKKFLNKVNQFAKDPNEALAKKLDSIIKEHTGMGSQALMKQIDQQEEPESP